MDVYPNQEIQWVDNNLYILMAQLKKDYDWIGLRYIGESYEILSSLNGKHESPQFNMSSGVQIEILYKGHLIYSSTSDLSLEGVKKAAAKAVALAEKYHPFTLKLPTSPLRPVVRGQYQTPIQKGLDQLTQQQIASDLNHITKSMKINEQITQAYGKNSYTQREQIYMTSEGGLIKQSFTYNHQIYFCLSEEGSQRQMRSLNGNQAFCYQGGSELWDPLVTKELTKQVAHQAIELLSAKKCPQEVTDLVIAPDQMLLQIHESIGHPLELDRILGDERNYAGASFIKVEDFGKLKFGSPLLNVVFDPTPGEAFASYLFDDCGQLAKKEFLIQDGILLRPLGGIESQLRTQLEGVSNMRTSSWNRAPIDRMANIDILPGSTSFENMISSIESGVYIETNKSWSIDDYRNKFQFGCEYAKEIKNGKLGSTLRNPSYRGECLKFWNSLYQVGDNQSFKRFGSPYCGKGEPSQIIRVSHASPVCHFKNIEVF